MAGSSTPLLNLTIYDAAIAFSDADCDEAEQIMEMMNNIDLGNGLKPNVCLYNNPQFSPSFINRTCCVVKNCLFIFYLLTKNSKKDQRLTLFINESIGITQFQSCGNCGLPPTLVQKKFWSVRPLHTQPEATRDYLTPLGLTTISGFDLQKPNIKDELRDFFNCHKNGKRFLKGCAESSNSSTPKQSTSATSPSSRSALALPEQEISLNTNLIPRPQASASHVPSLEKDVIKESMDNQYNYEMYEHITTDSAYNSSCASTAASYCPSISISENRNQVDIRSYSNPCRYSATNTEQAMEAVQEPFPRSLPETCIIGNGRLRGYGNDFQSNRNLGNSAAFPTPIKKKPPRKQKRSVSMVKCSFVQIGCGVPTFGNSLKGKFSPQNVTDDSDNEWSNEEPVFTHSVKESDKQESVKETVVPSVSDPFQSNENQSDSTETLNSDIVLLNNNRKNTIEESNDSVQQSIVPESLIESATASQIDQVHYGQISVDPTIPAANIDSNKDNPKYDQQAVNCSNSSLLSYVSADAQEALDNPDVLPSHEVLSPELVPHEEPLQYSNQLSTQEVLSCQEVLSREEPLSMGSIQQENMEVTRVPHVINKDQCGFGRADVNQFTSRFSHPGTHPFSYHSYHSLQSNHWPDRQMSFLDVAQHLTRLYHPPVLECDELD